MRNTYSLLEYNNLDKPNVTSHNTLDYKNNIDNNSKKSNSIASFNDTYGATSRSVEGQKFVNEFTNGNYN